MKLATFICTKWTLLLVISDNWQHFQQVYILIKTRKSIYYVPTFHLKVLKVKCVLIYLDKIFDKFRRKSAKLHHVLFFMRYVHFAIQSVSNLHLQQKTIQT